ncbi:TPA: hypothetical protein ACF3DY_000138 [Klebsiella quasipneumoniae subsp. similipneumoniae]
MTITPQAVNELIASLESTGELSIKETKVMALAKAYQQLAAENVQIKAMNDCLSEELRGYESDGTFEGPKMHLLWWQVETPATDAYLAGIKADGVEEWVSSRGWRWNGTTEEALKFAKQLREGKSEEVKS